MTVSLALWPGLPESTFSSAVFSSLSSRVEHVLLLGSAENNQTCQMNGSGDETGRRRQQLVCLFCLTSRNYFKPPQHQEAEGLCDWSGTPHQLMFDVSSGSRCGAYLLQRSEESRVTCEISCRSTTLQRAPAPRAAPPPVVGTSLTAGWLLWNETPLFPPADRTRSTTPRCSRLTWRRQIHGGSGPADMTAELFVVMATELVIRCIVLCLTRG